MHVTGGIGLGDGVQCVVHKGISGGFFVIWYSGPDRRDFKSIVTLLSVRLGLSELTSLSHLEQCVRPGGPNCVLSFVTQPSDPQRCTSGDTADAGSCIAV